MNNYLIIIKGYTLTIFSVGNPKLTKIYTKTYSYDTEIPNALHASNGYFVVIFNKYTT